MYAVTFSLTRCTYTVFVSSVLLKMTVLKKKKSLSRKNLKMHKPLRLVEEFERILGRICNILVLTPSLKLSVCRPRDRINRPNFYENCFNTYLSDRHLPFHIDITFVLDALIFQSLISPTFCDQYITT